MDAGTTKDPAKRRRRGLRKRGTRPRLGDSSADDDTDDHTTPPESARSAAPVFQRLRRRIPARLNGLGAAQPGSLVPVEGADGDLDETEEEGRGAAMASRASRLRSDSSGGSSSSSGCSRPGVPAQPVTLHQHVVSGMTQLGANPLGVSSLRK